MIETVHVYERVKKCKWVLVKETINVYERLKVCKYVSESKGV